MKLHTLHNPLALNKQTKTYLLIAAVLGIWGTIAYKIISGVSGSENAPALQDHGVAFTPKAAAVRDTFSIQLTERDPFLGSLATQEKKHHRPKASKPVRITKEDPVVSFEGTVKKQGGSNQVYVVTIDGEQVLLKKGQTLNGVTLVSGTSKRIKVRFNDKTQALKLN